MSFIPISPPSSNFELGELIGIVTADKNGLMPAGLFIFKSMYINKNTPCVLYPVNGVVFVRSIYSYSGYLMYLVTASQVKLICNPAGYGIELDLSITEANKKELTISTASDTNRKIEIIYQNLPYE